MPQQHIFGRNGGVGLELEHPMAVRLLPGEQRVACADRCASSSAAMSRASVGYAACVAFRVSSLASARRRSAARLPDRIAPSIVAGKPVSVQSPARTRLRHRVRAPGRWASCSGRRRKRRAPLAHDLPGRQRRRQAGHAPRPRARSSRASCFARRVDQPVGGADGHREPAGKGEDPFDRAVEHAESSAAHRPAASMRKCALTMARNSVGARGRAPARRQRRAARRG